MTRIRTFVSPLALTTVFSYSMFLSVIKALLVVKCYWVDIALAEELIIDCLLATSSTESSMFLEISKLL